MDRLIRNVVILGGGTAGWMTAAYLQKVLGGSVRITLMESAVVPKIGVGEATIPNLQRAFFDRLGIPEDEWMRECNASFKMGIKFVNWRKSDQRGPTNHFYHTFGLVPTVDNMPLSHYWVLRNEGRQEYDEPFAYACYGEPPAMDAKLAPRFRDGTRYTNYAWHFDAHLVAAFLCKKAVGWGVTRVVDDLERVERHPDGRIKALHSRKGTALEGDLFVDCSGFRGLLINKAMEEPFIDMSDHIFPDSAVASQVPHDDDAHGVEPYTSAIAMDSGWTWKIPMLGRFGTGYVYSSKFASEDQATRDFCALWKLDPDKQPLNKIRFRTGRNRNAWVKNCVSIGLSSAFLEPLESTGIYFIYAAIYQLAKHFPDKDCHPSLVKAFNREIEFMYDDCRDFVQAHYLTSSREDTPFWRANKTDLVLSDNIKDKLETYKAGLTLNLPLGDENSYYGNFETEFRNFWTNGSYYCVLSGMGWLPERPLAALHYQAEGIARAKSVFARVKEKQRDLLARLPTTHEFLKRLHGKDGMALLPPGSEG